jgi:2'-5' RNA ligase
MTAGVTQPVTATPARAGGRWRVAVAVVVAAPLAAELDVLRRALGASEAEVDRVAPHVTLVPPANMRALDLPAALAVLRAAAAGTEPFAAVLGPVTSFEPVTPTIHLAVSEPEPADEDTRRMEPAREGGDSKRPRRRGREGPEPGRPGQRRLEALHRAVLAPPLRRVAGHPFVAHVTLVEQAPLHRVHAARAALVAARFHLPVTRLTLLREQRGDDGRRRWRAVADVDLDGVRTVGRGGLPTELATGTLLDAEAAGALHLPAPAAAPGLVVTARREGELVGAAWGASAAERRASDDDVAHLLAGEWAFRAEQRRARDAPAEGP